MSLGPQPPQQLDLLLVARPRVVKSIPSAWYSTRSSRDPRRAGTALGQHVDLRRLLGHEHRLPLRQDDHTGDQLEGGDRGEEAESTNTSWNAESTS